MKSATRLRLLEIKTTRSYATDELVIQVVGRLDFRSVVDFRRAYASCLPAATYVVDLADAEVMTGAAVGILLNLRDWAIEQKATVVLSGVSKEFDEVLDMVRMRHLFAAGELTAVAA